MENEMKQACWIWYQGDFELYYAMKQNFSRVERGFGWPAFWKSKGFRNRVAFWRTYELEEKSEKAVTRIRKSIIWSVTGNNHRRGFV